ncbi:MAG: hypothetical protein NT075_14925 [Chloroflexi bacterium]|nr:hypothetical protein [Chloroflexota bacterium]
MLWSEIRTIFPSQWLVVEALEAHTTPDWKRALDQLAIIEPCSDGNAAMQRYRQLHQQFPQREFYFVHTGREELDIRVRQWLGVRTGYGSIVEGESAVHKRNH